MRRRYSRAGATRCVRYRRDLAYQAMHDQLIRRHPNYTYLPLTTREGTGPGGKVYIQDLITSGELEEQLGVALDPARTHVYLCGNPKMIGVPVKDRETGQRVFPKPHSPVFGESAKAVAEPDQLHAVISKRSFAHPANGRVQSRAVTARSENPNALCSRHKFGLG